jgi:hypothetical protein
MSLMPCRYYEAWTPESRVRRAFVYLLVSPETQVEADMRYTYLHVSSIHDINLAVVAALTTNHLHLQTDARHMLSETMPHR